MLTTSKNNAIDWELCVHKMSGKETIAKELLAYFVEELHTNREEFIQLAKRQDLCDIENAAHKLRGACCFFGVPRLQEQVTYLEEEAKKTDSANTLKEIISELIQRIDEVIDEFNNFNTEK